MGIAAFGAALIVLNLTSVKSFGMLEFFLSSIKVISIVAFLLVGLSGVDFGEHQKKTIPLAWLVSLVMVAVAILTRGIAI